MTAAARQKRRRSREALGLACYTVEIGEGVFDALVAGGLLTDESVCDRDKVSRALSIALAQLAQRQRHA